MTNWRLWAVLGTYLFVAMAYTADGHWRMHHGWVDSALTGGLCGLNVFLAAGIGAWRRRRRPQRPAS
jgi:hypothetical protein